MYEFSKRRFFYLSSAIFLTAILSAPGAFSQTVSSSQTSGSSLGLPIKYWAPLNSEQQIGEAIWFMAAPTYRYQSLTFPQRVGGSMDFWAFLRSDQRYEERYESGPDAGKIKNGKDKTHLGRWARWGLINDPDCCSPGKDCQDRATPGAEHYDERFAKDGAASITMEDTFGLDYCIGDKPLLAAVKTVSKLPWNQRPKTHADWQKVGWMEPACGAPYNNCFLSFGQPTGAIGFRKFPNPRFEADRWAKLNKGKIGSWEGWQKNIGDSANEAPFLIGTSCVSCHVSHNPVNPPKFADQPAWANLMGTIGSNYVHTSEIHASGLPEGHPLKTLFGSRPGITDTSAVPHDGVHNPGAMIPIMNFDVKPYFATEKYIDPLTHEPRQGTHHILKDGSDSVNVYNAIQRVYVNIGLCAEECWLNNLPDATVLDPHARNFRQTPIEVAQCYDKCPSMRAITGDKSGPNQYSTLKKVALFLANQRPTDLMDAEFRDAAGNSFSALKANNSQEKRASLHKFIEEKLSLDGVKTAFQPGDIEAGRKIFAGVTDSGKAKCASCHSSQYNSASGGDPRAFDFSKVNFWAEFSKDDAARGIPASGFGLPAKEGVRKDWLGNDLLTTAAELGVNRCRALHSNHMGTYTIDGETFNAGHVWSEYASLDYKNEVGRPDQTDALEGDSASGGRGYYRNVSLLSLWAFAPFLHNNSVGPEICAEPGHAEDLYLPAYRDSQLGCEKYDPSVMGRIRLYMASMDELLNPEKRAAKVTRTQKPIIVKLGLRIFPTGTAPDSTTYKKTAVYRMLSRMLIVPEAVAKSISQALNPELEQLKIEVPPGVELALVNNLDHKQLAVDIFDAMNGKPLKIADKSAEAVIRALAKHVDGLDFNPITFEKDKLEALLRQYNFCTDSVENKGHTFGSELNPEQKRQLTAFLLTI